MYYCIQFSKSIKHHQIGVYSQNEENEMLFSKLTESTFYGIDFPVIKFPCLGNCIDQIPLTNVPKDKLIIREDSYKLVKDIVNDHVMAKGIKVYAEDGWLNDFIILYPKSMIEVWDLDKSQWKGLDIPDWPKNRPLYMKNMACKSDLDGPAIARNSHYTMAVFNDALRNALSPITANVFVSLDGYGNC